jgi:hypothetical protein
VFDPEPCLKRTKPYLSEFKVDVAGSNGMASHSDGSVIASHSNSTASQSQLRRHTYSHTQNVNLAEEILLKYKSSHDESAFGPGNFVRWVCFWAWQHCSVGLLPGFLPTWSGQHIIGFSLKTANLQTRAAYPLEAITKKTSFVVLFRTSEEEASVQVFQKLPARHNSCSQADSDTS